MPLPHADHPIRSITRLAVAMLALFGILLVTSTKFDKTEIYTLIGMFLVLGGGEKLDKIVRKKIDG